MCLKAKESGNGRGSLSAASTLNQIATLHYHIQSYEQALVNYRKCLEIQHKHKGKDSIDCAYTLNNIGLALTQLQRNKEAFLSFRESLLLKE